MRIDPAELDPQQVYKLLAALAVPRPIAWVSTVGADGVPNVAPFSFFMVITSSPPHVAISIGIGERGEKDTLRNIRQSGELAINIVDAAIGPKMAISAAEWQPGVSEFEVAGLTPAAAEVVSAPLVAEAPASFEGLARQIIPIGGLPYGAHLVIVELVRFHVRDALLLPSGRVDLQALDAVGRLTGDWYCATREQYQLERPLPQ
jgi:flavin reductase (DIM6/NTAB) family NADH-FMN oxidoreductase RutF